MKLHEEKIKKKKSPDTNWYTWETGHHNKCLSSGKIATEKNYEKETPKKIKENEPTNQPTNQPSN